MFKKYLTSPFAGLIFAVSFILVSCSNNVVDSLESARQSDDYNVGSAPATNHEVYASDQSWAKAIIGGVKIAVDPNGIPWIINAKNEIFKNADARFTSSWNKIPGSATEIAIGANGAVWVVAADVIAGTTDHSVYKWNGSSWSKAIGAQAVKIAVDPKGVPWIVTSKGQIFKKADANPTAGGWGMPLNGLATDISISKNGSVWIVGTDGTQDYGIYRWNGSSWSKSNNISGKSIAVDPAGVPWVIKSTGQMFKKVDASLSSRWSIVHTGLASDIAVGGEGSVWIIGTDIISGTNDRGVYKGSFIWSYDGAVGVKIAVSPEGIPWLVDAPGQIFKKANANLFSAWSSPLPGRATDIGIGADGSVWITGTDVIPATNDCCVYKWNGTNWSKANYGRNGGIRIAVDPRGVPWLINAKNEIWQKTDATLNSVWNRRPGFATDIGIGADGSVWITGTVFYPGTTDYKVYKWDNGGWYEISSGIGISISVGPTGIPWIVNSGGQILRKNDAGLTTTGWSGNLGLATDISISANGCAWITGR